MEIWKDITGFEGRYQISSLGKVKSLAKNVVTYRGGVLRYPDRILKPSKSPTGYLVVALYNNGQRKDIHVHKLVALAFVVNTNSKPQVNHIDGNKSNNHADNLEWVTSSENHRHAFKLGLRKPIRGEKHGACKLSNQDVVEIIKLVELGKSKSEIAKQFSIHFQHVYRLINKERRFHA
jgi:hypothetical protein